MILNQTIEYGFRASACLAIHYQDGPVPSALLSERTGIPAGYLSKVMRRLVVAGLVRSQRGHGGGFHLAREPDTIRFLEILEALDFNLEEQRCAFGLDRCNSEAPCPLHESWTVLRRQFADWAQSQTLGAVAGGTCSVVAQLEHAASRT